MTNQIVGLLAACAYRTLVWDICVEAVSKPREDRVSDEARIAAALPRARVCLDAHETLKRPGRWLLGEQFTLADLHPAPMFAYFVEAVEGRDILAAYYGLGSWWARSRSRVSFLATRPAS